MIPAPERVPVAAVSRPATTASKRPGPSPSVRDRAGSPPSVARAGTYVQAATGLSSRLCAQAQLGTTSDDRAAALAELRRG